MSNLGRFSAALIATAVFATPAMASWYDKNGAVVHPSRVYHCVRAPDVGQFAGGPWANAPCEPAVWSSGSRKQYRAANARYRGGNYGGGSNNRGGLVGGADAGTYKP